MRKPTLAILVSAAVLIGLAALGNAADLTPGASAAPGAAPTGTTQTVRVNKWKLYQGTGAEIYHELCSGCHGVEGVGDGPAWHSEEIPAPALNQLRKNGVDRQHWIYVINAPYEDSHHWAPDGTMTCPPLNWIFRQAIGSDAGPLLVTKKLVAYLEEIQQ